MKLSKCILGVGTSPLKSWFFFLFVFYFILSTILRVLYSYPTFYVYSLCVDVCFFLMKYNFITNMIWNYIHTIWKIKKKIKIIYNVRGKVDFVQVVFTCAFVYNLFRAYYIWLDEWIMRKYHDINDDENIMEFKKSYVWLLSSLLYKC